jgi:hypothetical protein
LRNHIKQAAQPPRPDDRRPKTEPEPPPPSGPTTAVDGQPTESKQLNADDPDIPPSLDRRRLSAENQEHFNVLKASWINDGVLRRSHWENASPVVRHWFVREVLFASATL